MNPKSACFHGKRGVTEDTTYILEGYDRVQLVVGKKYLSSHFSGSNYFERIKTDGTFRILGRFPGQYCKTGTHDKLHVIDDYGVAINYSATSWSNAHIHYSYTSIESPDREN